MTAQMFGQQPYEDFERAKGKVVWRDLFGRLTRKQNKLLSLRELRPCLAVKGHRNMGLQVVPIDNIVGSEGKADDFDRAFFPRHTRSRDRWVSIDKAHYQHIQLPPVELIKVGDSYFVRDGNHRVSVARARGQGFVDARVTEIELSAPGP